MHRFRSLRPGIGDRIRVVSPSALRRAVIDRATERLAADARDGLFAGRPDLSARITTNGWQGAMIGAMAVAVPVGLVLAPTASFLAIHAIASIFFLACVALRLAASLHARPPRSAEIDAYDPADLPVYSVLVALYREAPIVPDLLVALSRIAWPRAKLEVKLVCEADDLETLEALRSQELRPWIEIVEVPPGLPRTKPKALAYALPLVSGEFVVLYDAEDRPHPLQLVEAWQHFSTSSDEIACLQAPLIVTNRRSSLVARLFAFEYAALFRGLLPFLAERGLMFPLGGTSNHFRRAAIEEIGGWDPYNVTEDADLGIRLSRSGYRSGVIRCPTFEDAPTDVSTWLAQRSRWFKGWAQTWLVHMRSPRRLFADTGVRSFVLAQVLFAGMLVSALVHPLLLATGAVLLLGLTGGMALSQAGALLLGIDLFNIVCGYGSFLMLGRLTLLPSERSGFWKVALFTPVYWVMMAVAAWRAVWQLYRDPHRWEKTPHAPRRRIVRAGSGPGGSEKA